MNKKKGEEIPVNKLLDNQGFGIIIKLTSAAQLDLQEKYSHRHDYHIFLLLENGKIEVEIDFQSCIVEKNSLIYIHPTQVHQVKILEESTVYLLGITTEKLNEEYFRLLEQAVLPSAPLELNSNIAGIIFSNVRLCMEVYDQRSEKLYSTVLRDQANSLIGQCISQFLQHIKSTYSSSRSEVITKSFWLLLEKSFRNSTKVSEYASKLNISGVYLRECVRESTGISVLDHITNRVVLEAKRLLYHSDKTVKEIALELGYEDYSYFSRLFKKKEGMSALDFRKKIRNVT